jgi:predicted outer membrane repeat protein
VEVWSAHFLNMPYSGNGGCLFSYRGNIALVDSNVSGNTATAEGGGIYSRDSNLYLANDTISKNSATAGGRISGYSGALDITHILVSGNTAPQGREAYIDSASGTIVTADAFNLFGHDGDAGISGFSLGSRDIVPVQPLPLIIDPVTGQPVPGGPATDICPSDAAGLLCDMGSNDLTVPPAPVAQPPSPSSVLEGPSP